jgi:aromatic-L-amino-acid decarboxylase
VTPEEFRRLGHRLIDWVADYREGIEQHPVLSQVAPGAIRASLPTSAPEMPEDLDALLIADVERLLMPGLTHWQHPNFHAYFPGNASYASVLADLLSTGLGQTGITWQASPALTELEETTCDWLRQLLGLSDSWQGVIHDTASTATLTALLCARERTTDHSQTRGGLQAESAPLVVYASREAHSSVEKAALLAGFGREHLRSIATDDAFAMRADALEAAIAEDAAAGRRPCAIVATTGTTATTAIDPLSAIARIAHAHGVWLHVDAAMAGSAMICPEKRVLWEGVEAADSIVMNPHKWLGVAFDCSLYLVRDAEHLVRVMSTNPSYLQSKADGNVRSLRDWGLPLGRRFRALKLWVHLRAEGAEALRTRLRRDMANAQWLAAQVDAAPQWVRLAPVPLQTVCVRHEPAGIEGGALDAHTLAWAQRVNASGRAFVTPSLLAGRWMVRVSIGAERTERAHVEALWALLQDCVRG